MPRNYSQRFRDRAVGLVFDRFRDGSGVSGWVIINDIGLKLGISRESLRRWVNQAEIDQGEGSEVTREESAEIRRLGRENAELRCTNEILKLASAFLAKELDHPAERGCKLKAQFSSLHSERGGVRTGGASTPG